MERSNLKKKEKEVVGKSQTMLHVPEILKEQEIGNNIHLCFSLKVITLENLA